MMEKYHMRKQERQITDQTELQEILIRGKYAVIAMCRDNEPYIVTLSYGYDKNQNVLFFHSAPKGLKIDFIEKNPDVCATIIDDGGYRKDECAHSYRSIVIFGKMVVLSDLKEKKYGLEVLLNHLEENPNPIKERNLKNDQIYNNITVIKLAITEITGKKGQ